MVQTQPQSAYFEGRMSLMDRLRFRAHLGMCRGCRTYLIQMKQTIRALGLLPPEAIPPHVRAELLARFRHWRR